MCGGNHPHVDRRRAPGAELHHFTLLQHAQQPALQRRRHLADFVEKNRAGMGDFEKARLAAAARAGKRPFLMAEQLAFDQPFGERRTVEGNERVAAPPAGIVDALRDQFLAGAAFAAQQHGGVVSRTRAGEPPHPFKRRRVADQIVQMVPCDQVFGPLTGAQRTVDPLRDQRVLHRQHRARTQALLDDRHTVDDQRAAADLLDSLLDRHAMFERPAQQWADSACQLRRNVLFAVEAEQIQHCRIDGFELAGIVEGGHAVAQMGDDRVQAHPLRFLLAAHARQFNGALERFFDRAERVQKNTLHAGLLGEIAGHARADDYAAALGRQIRDRQPHFVDRAIGALLQTDVQPSAQVREFVRDGFMQDEADLRARPARGGAGDRAQHVETVHLDHHHRDAQVVAQVGAVRSGGQYHIDRTRVHVGLQGRNGSAVAFTDRKEPGAIGITRRDRLANRLQAADTDQSNTWQARLRTGKRRRENRHCSAPFTTGTFHETFHGTH
ncbi:hypothetical protein KCU90_g993, partial [Aureobasidium melanogenum]